jgi:hypothetical protein
VISALRRLRSATPKPAALLALGMALGSTVARADERVVPEARIESARGMALGTGMRSASASTQAQAENAANLSVASLYHMESFFGYQPQAKRYGAGASVVDSTTSRIAAGLSARGLFGDNDSGENSGWEGRLSFGLALGEYVSLGVAGRFANFTISDPRARPERPAEVGEEADRTFKVKAFTMDAAVSIRPVSGLILSLLGYNLIATDSPLAPQLLGGGVSYVIQSIAIGGDILIDTNRHEAFAGGPKLKAGGGLEWLAEGVAPVRVGYMYDQGRHQHFVTGGLGYVDQRFGVQLSLRQTVAGVSETALFSAVQYFVPQ